MDKSELLKIAKPILFNTEMVRAILEGRKTVTRRICKDTDEYTIPLNDFIDNDIRTYAVRGIDDDGEPQYLVERRMPICVGDILYVRERYRKFFGMTYCWQGGAYIPAYDFEGINYFADDKMRRTDIGKWGELFLPDDDVKQDIGYEKWHPSIHMPKEAARIFLKVTNVRVEMLQDILCGDMQKEGCIPQNVTGGQWQQWQRDYFKPLWNSTIKKSDLDKYGWESNPFVWVYEFERV